MVKVGKVYTPYMVYASAEGFALLRGPNSFLWLPVPLGRRTDFLASIKALCHFPKANAQSSLKRSRRNLFHGAMPIRLQPSPSWALLFFTFCALLTVFLSRVQAKVVISEVMWMGSDLSTADEWVELAGLGSGTGNTTDISGFTLTSLTSTKGEVPLIKFGTGTSIGSGQFIVISRYAEGASRLLSAPFQAVSDLSLPNTKLLLRLRDTQGQVVDEVDDGVGEPFAGTNVSGQPKASMQRKDLWAAGTVKDNWMSSVLSLGFDEGFSLFGTPGFSPIEAIIEDTEPPVEVTGLAAEGKEEDTGVTVKASWTPGSSTDLVVQELTLTASGTLLVSAELPATSTGLTIPAVPLYQSYQLTVRSIDDDSNISFGSSVTFEPLLKTINPNTFSIQLGEVLPRSLDENSAWVEIVSGTSATLDLSGWALESSGSTFNLTGSIEAGEYRSFSMDPGVLSHTGTLLLTYSGSTMDQVAIPLLPPGVSYRKADSSWGPECMPSPGSAGEDLVWHPEFSVETLSNASGSFLIKSFIQLDETMISPIECAVDWGDGEMVNGCNEHQYEYFIPGSYTLTSTIVNYCGTTVIQQENVEFMRVTGSISSSLSVSSSSTSSSASFSSVSSSSSQVSSGSPSSSGASGGGGTTGSSASSFSSSNSSVLSSGEGLVLYAAFPNPKGTDTGKEWVELWNKSSSILFTNGWSLATKTTTKPLPESTILPGEVLRISIPTGMSLGNTDGVVKLKDPHGAEVSVLTWPTAGDDEEISFLLSSSQPATVTRVLDGDTFEVTLQNDPLQKLQKVRLIGVDAPELTSKDSKELGYANESKKYTSDLIENKKIELQFDTRKKDAYGRILAYVYTEDGQFLQKNLLERGFARVYLASEFQKKADFQAFESTAKELGVGVWGISSKSSSKSSVLSSKSSSQSSLTEEEIVEQKIGSGALIITEIYSHPKKSGTGVMELEEWVEVFNASDEPIDLSFVFFSKSPSDTKKYKIQSGSVVDPQSYEVIFPQSSGLKLNNDGGELSLKNFDGSFVEYILYPKIKEGNAYADMSDFDVRTNWCLTLQPTPGSGNICELPEVPAKATKVKATSTSKSSAAKKTTIKKSTAAKKAPVKVSMMYHNVSAEEEGVGAGSGGLLMQGSLFSGSFPSSGAPLGQSFLFMTALLLGVGATHFYNKNALRYNKEAST